MKVSIVINTLNRAEELQMTLASLALQRYRNFEVIVVNGPSDDRTPEVIRAWSSHIKAAFCPEANLSMSRNIGVAAASGDIVAFIDDDAIPEPTWLSRIVSAYDSPDIGGVGGWVHDASGHAYQTKYILCDRFATSRTDIHINPTPYYNSPGTVEYYSLLGTNSSFLRSALVEMGGFDEEFAYYLDETDVCLRLVDRGYQVVFVEDARVLHKFAPSHLRNQRRVLRNRYQIIKNQCYFSFLHGAPAAGYAKALAETQKFVEKHRQDVNWCIGAGLLDSEAALRFEKEAEDGVRDGIVRAVNGTPSHRPVEYFGQGKPFFPFSIKGLCGNALTIVLISQSYPPGYVDGVGRFTAELAFGLAELGHEVHVITSSQEDNRVDLEEMVWVHRVKAAPDEGRDPDIPPGIWAKSAAALAEIKLIEETAKIDVVQATGWDAEGIAALRRLRSDAVLITSLHTPMLVAAANHPNWLVDEGRMTRDILPIMRLERELFLFSDGIYANSEDIVETVQRHYDVRLERLQVVPHGMRDRVSLAGGVAGRESEASSERLRILFVGRLETRKGIDVLLDAIPKIFESLPNAELWLIGQDHTESAAGESTVAAFRRRNGSQAWLSRVKVFGKIEKEFLDEYYQECDLVVMPSRYESFGLVLLEAMMHALPVVAARVGGMKEVVADGETGLLTPAGDVDAFAEAVIRLGREPQTRRRLGANGRKRFEEKFTAAIMAEQSVTMYRHIMDAKRDLQVIGNRLIAPKDFPLSRPWALSDFWHESPLKTWASVEWFFPSIPIWIALLAREACFRKGGDQNRRRTLVIGSSEPLDFVEDIFPGAVHVARGDLPNRGYWADSGVPKRDLARLGLRGEDFDVVLVLKPLPEGEADQENALVELARLVRPSGTLAFTTTAPLGENQVERLGGCGFVTADLEPSPAGRPAPAWSIVVTRGSVPSSALGPNSAHLSRSSTASRR
jgi:glycosyltransferase involved in cell wall biosynthesis